MNQTIRNIWNGFSTVLVALVVLLAALLWGPRLIGMEVFTVLSGSMEPAYHTGGCVYVREVDADKLEVGDVITFRLSGSTVATHRIIETLEEDGTRMFRTKGDANEDADNSPVTPDRIIGKVAFGLPYLGYLAAFIQSTSGRYAAIAAGAFILLIVFLPDLLFPQTKEKENVE